MNPHIRSLVEGALDRIVAGERADRVLDRVLRANRDLSPDDRRHVAERTLGISLWRGRLDALADGERSLWYPLFLADREQLDPAAVAASGGLDVDVFRRALTRPEPPDPIARLAFRRSLPIWLAARWIEQFGEGRADALAAAMNERGPIAVRANRLLVTRDELQDRLQKEGVSSHPGRRAPDALVLHGRPNILGLEAWREGLFEVQDEGSQLLAAAVPVRPGDVVIDLCAGAGGKTLALAAAMEDRGRLVAIDLNPHRIRDLEVRARRAGVTCVEARCADGADAAALTEFVGTADAVLVDAPCSELGTLRRGPDARWRIQPDDPARFALVQRALLHSAATLVRSGGALVYATCSLDSAENEGVSGTLDPARFETISERHLAPDLDGTDGFYERVFRRRA